MSASNHRDKRPDTLHHLTSRIAHRVYFLEDEERTEFVDLLLAVSSFTGIRLLGWCIMTNHFHVFAYLPQTPCDLSDDEVMMRYETIAAWQGRDGVACDFKLWQSQGTVGADRIREAILRLRRRMYDIGWFMKMVKQWFTESYNRRCKHKGTLWEATYGDRVIEGFGAEARDCLCYIHLNPIRAAVATGFDDYRWSSLFKAGPGYSRAVEAMRLLYPDTANEMEMMAAHHHRMDEILEDFKKTRALEIARKRALGFPAKADPLTGEAMLAQAAARIEMEQSILAAIRSRREIARRASERRAALEDEIAMLVRSQPGIQVDAVIEVTGRPRSTVYRIMAVLRASGRIRGPSRSPVYTSPS